jgi:hypothetical protein
MPSKKTDESPDANLVLVEVNGQTLSSSQLDDLVEAQMAQQGASLKPDQVADAIRHFRAHAIRDFITQVLLEDEAAARKLEVPAGSSGSAIWSTGNWRRCRPSPKQKPKRSTIRKART